MSASAHPSKTPDSGRPAQIDQIHDMFAERMSIPHSGKFDCVCLADFVAMDNTSSAYSAFCSTYSPEDYEKRLVQATGASQVAKAKWSIEKRYGKTREDLEQQLVSSCERRRSFRAGVQYGVSNSGPGVPHICQLGDGSESQEL